MKNRNPIPRYTTRIDAPKPGKDKDGKPAMMCPFCNPSHPLVPGLEAPCGTNLQVRAVQIVYKSKFHDDMVCAKCGKSGDQMVRFQNAFIHIKDCAPGVATLTEAPKFSKLARLFYNPPARIKLMMEKLFGRSMAVDEVTPDGKRTGRVLGYFFMKKGTNP